MDTPCPVPYRPRRHSSRPSPADSGTPPPTAPTHGTATHGTAAHGTATHGTPPTTAAHGTAHGTSAHETGTHGPAPTTPTADLDRGGARPPPGHAPVLARIWAADQADRAILAPPRRSWCGRRGGHRGGVDVQRHHRRAHRLGLGRVLEPAGWWVVRRGGGRGPAQCSRVFAGSAGRPSGFCPAA